MKKKIMALALVACVALLAIGGATLAYLQDTDSATNVMTVGKVDIEQNEYQLDENGDKEPFVDDKLLMPYVGNVAYAPLGSLGTAYTQFTMENVLDKYVTVKNTGNQPAYVRTIIAFEIGTLDPNAVTEYAPINGEHYKYLGISINDAQHIADTWEWENATKMDRVVNIGGKNYMIMVATHKAPVAAGEETVPSLRQVYLDKTATNEVVAKLDNDGNGKFNIYAISQAVQSQGFEAQGAKAALNAAFGEVTDANLATWLAAALA